jgi:hypothetical protein
MKPISTFTEVSAVLKETIHFHIYAPDYGEDRTLRAICFTTPPTKRDDEVIEEPTILLRSVHQCSTGVTVFTLLDGNSVHWERQQ